MPVSQPCETLKVDTPLHITHDTNIPCSQLFLPLPLTLDRVFLICRRGTLLAILAHADGLPDLLLVAGSLDKAGRLAEFSQGVSGVFAVILVSIVVAHDDFGVVTKTGFELNSSGGDVV